MSSRYVDIIYRNKHARLLFTMKAMLDIEDTYNDAISNIFTGNAKEVFERECYALSFMSYEGKINYKEEELDALQITELASALPYEVNDLVGALYTAISLGLKRDIEPEEVDEGLLELKKKKESQEQKRQNT